MADSYAALENESLYQHLFKHRDENTSIVQLQLPSMHCANCVKAVETLPNIAPEIIDVRVNFSQKEATIKYHSDQTNLRRVAEKLDAMGYSPDVSLASETVDIQPNKHRRRATIELGIAGFVFGNTMLFAFPEYMGLDEPGMVRLFHWLTAALSIPLLVFSARSFITSAWRGIRQWKGNMDIPITLGIIALAGYSFLAVIEGTGAGYFDSLAGLVFFLLVGRWFQTQTYARLDFERDYKSYFPFSALRINGGNEEYVKLTDIRVGDILKVRHGELIPTDGEVISGDSSVDMQFITGESDPQAVSTDSSIFAGSRLVDAAIEYRVTKGLDQSYLTTLWAEDPRKKKPKSAAWIDTLGQRFTAFVLTVSAITGVVWYTIDPSMVIWVVASVLIIACPCALALSIPFGLGHTVRHLNNYGAFVKSTQTIERLSRINAWVLDKTGTLTDSNAQTWESSVAISEQDQQALRALVSHSAHPISRSLTQHWQEVTRVDLTAFEEHVGQGVQGMANGSVYQLGQPQWVGAEDAEQQRAVAWSKNGQFGGFLIPRSPFRPNLKEGLTPLQPMALLTGDHDGERNQLNQLLPEGTEMRFRQSPHDKLEFVQAWQAEGHRVAMVGDGLNDAGALAVSDVGISIADDAFHFAPACDILLQGDKLHELHRIQRMAQAGLRVVRTNIVVSLSYNAIGLSFAVQGLLTPLVAAILMPISSLSVVGLSYLLVQRAKKKILG